jgi:hypothetical protein
MRAFHLLWDLSSSEWDVNTTARASMSWPVLCETSFKAILTHVPFPFFKIIQHLHNYRSVAITLDPLLSMAHASILILEGNADSLIIV